MEGEVTKCSENARSEYLNTGALYLDRLDALDGKAYKFYMQKFASNDLNNWNLHKFFTELFNFCFPVNYRHTDSDPDKFRIIIIRWNVLQKIRKYYKCRTKTRIVIRK
jgi:hypothetical protein